MKLGFHIFYFSEKAIAIGFVENVIAKDFKSNDFQLHYEITETKDTLCVNHKWRLEIDLSEFDVDSTMSHYCDDWMEARDNFELGFICGRENAK